MADKMNWNNVNKELNKYYNDTEQAQYDADVMADITTAIFVRCHQLGLSQRKLAKICNMPQSTFSRIFTNQVSPNLDTLFKILKALDLKLSVVPVEK